MRNDYPHHGKRERRHKLQDKLNKEYKDKLEKIKHEDHKIVRPSVIAVGPKKSPCGNVEDSHVSFKEKVVLGDGKSPSGNVGDSHPGFKRNHRFRPKNMKKYKLSEWACL